MALILVLLISYFMFNCFIYFRPDLINVYGQLWGNLVHLGSLCIIFAYNSFGIILRNENLHYSGGAVFSTPWGFTCTLDFSLDFLNFFFSLLVLIIGFATNLYISKYFSNQAQECEFATKINLFIISMLIFVLANSLFTVFLG